MWRHAAVFLLVVFTLAVYLSASFGSGLLDDADAGHAEVSKEMLERGDWVVFYTNGIRYLEKGPLLFWMGAISFELLGVNEVAARVPAVVAILALALVCFAFGRRLGGDRAGFYAGLIFASGWGVFLFTRIFIPDILVTFSIALAMYCYWRSRQSRLHAYGFWIALALAVLGKGLIGMIFPLAAVGLYILATRRWSDIAALKPVPGAVLFLLLAAPWHILASLRTPKFAWFYFVNEHFLRFLGKRYPMDYDTVPLVLFWAMLLIWLFPFSVFLPLAFRGKRELGEDRPELLLWLWAGVVMVFFSFSTRQEYYSMPAWPPLALLAALGLSRAEERQSPWPARLQALLALVGVAAGVVLGALLWVSRNVEVRGDIASLLTSNPEMYRLSLGHMFDLQPSTFAALRLPAAGAALVLSFGFGYAWLLRRKKRHLAALLATAATSGLFLLCAHLAFIAFEPYLSSRPLARAIERVLQPGDLVVINGEYYNGSSVGFYLKPKIYMLNGVMTDLEFGSHYPDAPPLFIGDRDIQQWWTGGRRIFLFTKGEDRAAVEKLLSPGSVSVIASSGGKFVLSNRP